MNQNNEKKIKSVEHSRIISDREGKSGWRKWGPYLSERAWGTVREDYSVDGNAWEYLPHDLARSKAYRWGEDGIAGISDNMQYLCFSMAFWNGNDPILKERLFGLTGNEGNHGEDVKEYYFYLDNTPTHSYMKYLYKYPQAAFPYKELVEGNRSRGRNMPELELIDTGVFKNDSYFDIFVEYAKASPEDIHICITVINRGSKKAEITILPTFWFRNIWSWNNDDNVPVIKKITDSTCQAEHPLLGTRWIEAEKCDEWIFTENETDHEALYGIPSYSPYVKNSFHKYIVNNNRKAVNPGFTGTKAAAVYKVLMESQEEKVFNLRLNDKKNVSLFKKSDSLFKTRKEESNEFYNSIVSTNLTQEEVMVQQQAYAGLLWTKQFYYYDVETWLKGDPAMPVPPPSRLKGRNKNWTHLNNADIISMPDKWEYPWYATWDLAFHTLPLAKIDPCFAKEQLLLICKEWYMHPNGQLPAFEWSFENVNPPVQAWAAMRVYQIEKKHWGNADTQFLEKIFQKLLLNFTWWVNRKDEKGHNLFQGGFLGLDNISVFDRSTDLPANGHLEQSDGTSWMAMYCLNMLTIALELARTNPVYEDMATKFFEHFIYIAHAMNNLGGDGIPLWNEEDGFYYDVLSISGEKPYHMKVRSIVGLIPLFAVHVLDDSVLESLPDFKRHLEWFIKYKPELCKNISCMKTPGASGRRLLSIVNRERLSTILSKMLDSCEFLSDYGIRSLSKYHKKNPYILYFNGSKERVDYDPAESSNRLFGGNSNWRGPVWFPINYLIIESLEKLNHYYKESLTVECPTGSGKFMTLDKAADEISKRLVSIFKKEGTGKRPFLGKTEKFQTDPHFRDYILYYEYFHGDNGSGVGASHQTGWTALVANLIQKLSRSQCLE